MTTTTRRRLGSLALAGLLLAACSGGDDDDGGAAGATTTTAAVDVAAELEAQLLTLDDLATDDALDAPWAEGNVQDGVDIQLPDCVVEEPGAGSLGAVEAKFVTENQFKLPSLEEDLAGYEDAEAAKAAFDAAVARLDGCGEPQFVFQGTPSTGTIARLPLTLGGDEAAAWRTSVTIAGAAVSVTTVHVLVGDVALSLVHTDIAQPDPAVLEGFVAKAVAQLA